MPITQILFTQGSAAGGGGGGGGGGGSYTGSGPVPGENRQTSWPDSAGWSTQGSAYIVDGGVASIDNPQNGWMRRIYPGIWSMPGINGNDVPSLFNGAPTFQEIDIHGGFGQSGTGDNYAMEWKGYIQIFNTGTGVYNFLLDSDDISMFWIGSAALDPNFDNKILWTNNGSQLNSNSVILSNGLYYPIRMRFQEWSGAERCQVYMGQVGSGSPLQSMSLWPIFYNGNTQGY